MTQKSTTDMRHLREESDPLPAPLRHANTFHSRSNTATSQAVNAAAAAAASSHHGSSLHPPGITSTLGSIIGRSSSDMCSMSVRAQQSIVIGADILGEHVFEEEGSDEDEDFTLHTGGGPARLPTMSGGGGNSQLQRNLHGGSGRGGRSSGGLLGNHRVMTSPQNSDIEPQHSTQGRATFVGDNPLSPSATSNLHHGSQHVRNGANSSSSFVDWGAGDSLLSGATPPALHPISAAEFRLGSTLTSQGNTLAQHWTRCESPVGSVSGEFNTISCSSYNPSRRQSVQPTRQTVTTFCIPGENGSPGSPSISSKLNDGSPHSLSAQRHNSIRPASIAQVTSTCTSSSDDDGEDELGDTGMLRAAKKDNTNMLRKNVTGFPKPSGGGGLGGGHPMMGGGGGGGGLTTKLSPTTKMGELSGGGAMKAAAVEEEDGDDDDRILEEMFEEVERARETTRCNFSDFRLRHYPMNVLPPDYTAILTELSIAENRFASLPDEAFAGMVGVTRLDLSNNKLTTIPASILTLPALETLLCDHNQITHLPLDTAVQSGKRILPSAKTIGLEWNELEAFPVQLIQECANLEMLYVGENPNIFSNTLPSAEDLRACHRAKMYLPGKPILKVKCVNRPRFVEVVDREDWASCLPWLTLDWNKIYPDKVLDFLYLGSLRTAQTPLVYEDLNIGFVLTAGRGLDVQITKGMRHLELVVDDIPGAAADIEPLFDEAFAFIEEARKAKKGILIHCFAGLSRSVTLTVAYLMKTLFPMSRDDALALIRQSRPAAEPNRGFMETLLKFEKILRKTHEAKMMAKRALAAAKKQQA